MSTSTIASDTIAASEIPSVEVDPITYEVIRHKLVAIVAQQSAVLKNVSGSPLVFESNDCNTGIYLPDGEIVTMGPHIVFHSGSMEMVVSHIIDECDPDPGINAGDVFITNDPYRGALHLPDVTMLEPVIYDGVRVGWVGSCCHVLDIGGMTPSSWCPDATQAYQEGLILPPTKLVADGKIRSDVWRLILSASRLPANLGLDLKAMIAANTHARDGMIRLLDRYGVATVMTVMRTMLDKSEEAVRRRITELPDATFRARNYFDFDGHQPNLSRIEVEMTKHGDELSFDFAQTSPQVPGIFNCTESGLRGGVFAAVLPVLAPDIPWNSGVMRALKIDAPLGSIVNAKHPAPCGAATVGASYMVKNVAHAVVAALASTDEQTRGEAMAESTGSIPVLHVGGLNQYGEGFGGAITEALSGGGGATLGADGIDVAGPHEILEYKFTNVEGDESNFPLLWLKRELDTDGGGAGRRQGGRSLNSSFTVHDAGFVHGVLVCHSLSMPASTGLHGGMPGSTHHVSISRGTAVNDELAQGSGIRSGSEISAPEQTTEYTASPGEMMLFPGDVVDWSFHGGGGLGDPLQADIERVVEYVRDARISATAAERLYGVVLAGDAADQAATAARRDQMRAQRLAWQQSDVFEGAAPEADAPRRLVGDRLQVIEPASGEAFFGCECGHVLAPASQNWKLFTKRGRLEADDLGEKIRLHPGLISEGFACPSCATLLSVEVRAADDPVLHEYAIA